MPAPLQTIVEHVSGSKQTGLVELLGCGHYQYTAPDPVSPNRILTAAARRCKQCGGASEDFEAAVARERHENS